MIVITCDFISPMSYLTQYFSRPLFDQVIREYYNVQICHIDISQCNSAWGTNSRFDFFISNPNMSNHKVSVQPLIVDQLRKCAPPNVDEYSLRNIYKAYCLVVKYLFNAIILNVVYVSDGRNSVFFPKVIFIGGRLRPCSAGKWKPW